MTEWPQTLRHAPLVDAAPPQRGNESNTDYRNRQLRWRSWAASPRPDLWFVTDNEVADWEKWKATLGEHHAAGR